MTPEDRIREIARECARKNLRLRDARALFDALHTADALFLANGSITKAAEIQKRDRVTLMRQRAAE